MCTVYTHFFLYLCLVAKQTLHSLMENIDDVLNFILIIFFFFCWFVLFLPLSGSVIDLIIINSLKIYSTFCNWKKMYKWAEMFSGLHKCQWRTGTGNSDSIYDKNGMDSFFIFHIADYLPNWNLFTIFIQFQ